MKVETKYYDDLLNDDFAGTKIKHKILKPGFKFVHKNPFWNVTSWLVYYLLALPILGLVGKIGYGIKIKGKKNIHSLRHQGIFIYGNHTQIADAWIAQCYIVNPKRCYVLANSDAVSMRGLSNFVMMLGCLPIPETVDNKDAFKEAINLRYRQKRAIAIFPEKHIWKYSTHIRPFPDDSFVYPSEIGAPAVAIATTYRRRKVFKNLRPKMTVHVSRPFYPDMSLSMPERKKALRDQVYEFLVHHAAEDENVETIRYLPRPQPQEKKEAVAPTPSPKL